MCHILANLQKYCPNKPSIKEFVLPNGECHKITNKDTLCTLFGGDQLTCVRAHTAKWLRSSHDKAEDALDWHSRMCLLRVSMMYM